MRKIPFYIPAIFFTVFYAWVVLRGAGGLQPIVTDWLLLFWLSGVLLSRNIFLGGILGILPAINFIYLGTQSNGQQVNIEIPVGIIVMLYYVTCIFWVFKKKRNL